MLVETSGNILDFAGYANFVLNPTNLIGPMGKGLARAFANKYPGLEDSYKAVCKNGRMVPGSLHMYPVSPFSSIINIPTKHHYNDELSDVELIRSGLTRLRDRLMSRPGASIIVPLLGSGLGNLTPSTSRSVIKEVLGEIPNPVIIMDIKSKSKLKFHAIIGSREILDVEKVFSLTLLSISSIGMDVKRLQNLDIYDGIVSGGARGIDTIGVEFAKRYGKPALIFPAEWDVYGKAAGNYRNEMIARMAASASVFTTPASKGTWHTLGVLKQLKTPYRLFKCEIDATGRIEKHE